MSSRQSRTTKRSLAVSTTSSTGTGSTARSSTADNSPANIAAAAAGGGRGGGGGNRGNDRGPLSGVLSDDDGLSGGGKGGRRGGGGMADDDSIISLSFRSHSTAASASRIPHGGGGGGGGASGHSKDVSSLSTSLGGPQASTAASQLDPSDPRLHLASLNDERSTFGAVSRSCLALNQWAGGGVGGAVDDGGLDLSSDPCGGTADIGPTVCSSLLLCPSDHPAVTMPALRSLIACCTTHTDRRCRIMALRTLALVARSAYARTREGEMGRETFTQRDDGAAARVEDEVVNDVAVTLLGVGMDEDDDGISSAAFEAAGMLVLGTSSITPGASALAGRFDGGYDALSADLASILTSDPIWRGCGDPSWISSGGSAGQSSSMPTSPNATAQHELSSRVYSSIVPPRIRRILHRISLYRPTPPFGATAGTSNVERTLPFVTGALGYMLKTEGCSSLGLDKAGYAKRWTEMDSRGMATEAVDTIILPILTDGASYGIDGPAAAVGAGKGAALAALRLVHACPGAEWAEEVCRSVVGTMTDAIRSAAAGEELLDASVLAIMMIALRGLRPVERGDALSLSVDAAIKLLPATEVAPATIGSAGLPLSDSTVRRPVRLGLFIEAALLALMPNPIDGDGDAANHDKSVDSRSDLVFGIFGSPIVQSVLTFRSEKKRRTRKGKENIDEAYTVHDNSRGLFSATSAADEVAFVFCSVANVVGRRLLGQFYDKSGESARMKEEEAIAPMESWLRSSVALLYELSSCLSWQDTSPRAKQEGGRNKEYDGHDSSYSQPQECMTVSAAARGAYLKLLSQCLAATDLINASSSVTANMLCFTDNGKLDEGFVRFAASAPLRDDTLALGTLSDLMDWIAETKLREGVSHSGVRISLLALLSDYWVQVCRLTLQSQEGMNGTAALGLNEMNAREILSMLASEISMLIDEQERAASSQSSSAASESVMHSLFVCIACIENMALSANDWSRRFGNRSSMANSEDSSYIVSVSTAILNGQGRTDEDEGILVERLDPDSPASIRRGMIEECVYAARRIQAVAAEADNGYTNGGGHFDQPTASIYCSPLIERERSAFLQKAKNGVAAWSNWASHSSLTLEAGRHISTPLVGSHEVADVATDDVKPCFSVGDIFDHSYLFHHYRQAIIFRAEVAMRSAQVEFLHGFGVNKKGHSQSLKPCEPLRLSIPPPSTPTDGGNFRQALLRPGDLRWIESSTDVCGTSDPISIRTYFSDMLCPRYDGEVERRLVIVIKMYNMTAVPIPGGVRMDLTVEPSSDETIDLNDGQHNAVLGAASPPSFLPAPLSTTAFHRQEIKAGDHVTWTIETHGWTNGGGVLNAAVSFRDLESESTTMCWIKQKPVSSVKTSLSEVEEGNEGKVDDDFSVGQGSSADFLESEAEEEGDEIADLFLMGEPVFVPPSIVLQACPLVFFRDANGDEMTFRFLWTSMPHRFVPIKCSSFTASVDERHAKLSAGYAAREVARHSKVVSVGGYAEAWAFSSWNSKLILCVLIRDKANPEGTLYVRGDSETLLQSLVGSNLSRDVFVSDLTGGQYIPHC